MTLTVTAPGPDPITTLSSGLKIIRLSEYIGGARGTLTTVTDTDSPAVTVVKDTQELAVATTNAGRGASVSDTVSIPVADLGIGPGVSYNGYIGIRVVGRPPIGARAGELWNTQFKSVGPSVCRVHDSLVFTYYPVPRETYAGYTLINAGGFSPLFLGSTVNLRFRAWGITGGNMEFYLDLFYLIPNALTSADIAGSIAADEFAPLFLFTNSSGDLGPNQDSNTNNAVGTAHSVMPDFYYDSVWDWDVSHDIQDGEYEKSVVDWKDIFFSDPYREVSWIYFPAGSRLVNAYTILSEDFSAWPGEFPLSQYDEVDEGYVIETATANFVGLNLNPIHDPPGPEIGWAPGWYLMNESVQFLGPDAASGIGVLPLTIPAHAAWSIGTDTVRAHPVSGGGSSDPRNIAPLLQGFDSINLLHKVNLLMSHSGGDVEMHFGCARWSAVNTAHQTRVTVTAKVIHHADGTHSIGLHTTSFSGEATFATPVTVMGALAPGDSYWVRVEKRFNHWRARCWIDGDTEPSTWDIEGFSPAWVRLATAPGNSVTVDYPYNVNWPTNVSTIEEDPRYWHGSFSYNSSPTPWMHEARITCRTGFSTSNYEIQVDECTFIYDPDFPNNSGEHTGAYFRMEKYDGSVDWGTAYIPPGSWRIVTSDYAAHHFDVEAHGGNMYAWKETGAHPLQTASWQVIRFRRSVKRPQWGDITFP